MASNQLEDQPWPIQQNQQNQLYDQRTISWFIYGRRCGQWPWMFGQSSESSCGLVQQVHITIIVGFIILVVPFVFGYLQEMQNEMARMMASNFNIYLVDAGNKVMWAI